MLNPSKILVVIGLLAVLGTVAQAQDAEESIGDFTLSMRTEGRSLSRLADVGGIGRHAGTGAITIVAPFWRHLFFFLLSPTT